MTAVTASHVYYIKLGRGGDWEAESLRDGVLRFGYREAPHELCEGGDWQGVWEAMKSLRSDAGAATRDVNQIRAYYEADEQSIFITFVGGLLYWCPPSGPVELLDDGSHRRATATGWRKTSMDGTLLSADRLSGRLLKVQMFRGTICDVRAGDYLLRKLSNSSRQRWPQQKMLNGLSWRPSWGLCVSSRGRTSSFLSIWFFRPAAGDA